MSKPTKEIIELAKKLHELGYRQEEHLDTWVILSIGKNEWLNLASNIIARVPIAKPIPIPSLDDGLEWFIKEKWVINIDYLHKELEIKKYKTQDGEILLRVYDCYTFVFPIYEAVLKAMVQVLEAKK